MALDGKLEQLEGRVVDLLTEMKRLRREHGKLQEESVGLRQKAEKIDVLREEAGEAEALREENARLLKRIAQMEEEMTSSNTKEDEIRGRLRSIIEKIDALEQVPDTD